MYYIAKYLGLHEYIYSKEDIYNNYLIDIKNNLKHTITLKKKFYIPSKLEILNKHFMIQLKNKPKINIQDIIDTKNNLKPIN